MAVGPVSPQRGRALSKSPKFCGYHSSAALDTKTYLVPTYYIANSPASCRQRLKTKSGFSITLCHRVDLKIFSISLLCKSCLHENAFESQLCHNCCNCCKWRGRTKQLRNASQIKDTNKMKIKKCWFSWFPSWYWFGNARDTRSTSVLERSKLPA